MNKVKLAAIGAMIVICVLAGCTEAHRETSQHNVAQIENTVTFTDDLGRELTIKRPERVVTLISSFADVWHLAGGVDQIVATTNATWTYFDLPLKSDVINLGATKSINLEQLIACEPDLIIASCGTDRNLELEDSLEQMGLAVAYFSVNTLK